MTPAKIKSRPHTGDPRFSWEPIDAWFANRGINPSTLGVTVSPLALLGFHSKTERARYHRARRRGYLSLPEADEIAIYLGFHPSELWAEYWDHVEAK